MSEPVFIAAAVVIGLLAGSLLTEGVILIPYWRRMEPAEFFRLHASMGPGLFRYFAPMTTAAVGLGVVAALLDQGRSPARIAAAGLCLTILAIFFVYFRKANASFAAHAMADDALGAELGRWQAWHWLRTVLAILALTLSLVGLRGGA